MYIILNRLNVMTQDKTTSEVIYVFNGNERFVALLQFQLFGTGSVYRSYNL